MWIFLNDSFLSIVAHQDRPGFLLVRARAKGDIERVFQQAAVRPGHDYAYRAEIEREQVTAILARRIEGIDYPNFKNSVRERDRHDVYMDIWEKMLAFQDRRRARSRR